MNPIVRRVEQNPAPRNETHQLPARTHRASGVFVESQLSLGIEPKLRICWAVLPRYWDKGFKLLVFRSATGFCPETYPDDLNQHGQLIIETNRDASHEECPAEGTHYFTFVLYKRVLLGLSEKMSIVRFSETVPSAKVALGRLKDQIDLRDMLQKREVGEIEHETKLAEAELRRIHSRRNLEEAQNPAPRKNQSNADALINDEISNIEAMVDAVFAKRQKIADLKKDPRFKKLSRQERETILAKLEERLDAGEISARREMRGG
jgi:hypothetical protein